MNFFNSVLIFALEKCCVKKYGSRGDQSSERMNFDISWNFIKEHVLHLALK